MEIREEIAKRAERIDEWIRGYLPDTQGRAYFERTLREAMNYSVLAGGKRLRPMLMEACFELFGGQGTVIRPYMAAIEMIHTYSLVHDDLPAMDNDLYRRGKKTTHAVYGEAMGILAGDGLLNYAYEIVATAMTEEASKGDSDRIGRMVRAFAVLSSFAGVKGMVGGQSVDVESEQLASSAMPEVRLNYIYEAKTGALIQASMMIGAILADANEEDVSGMWEIGRCLGKAFQIQDDILDVTGSREVLGKSAGNDEKNHKATYVTIWGLRQAKEEVERLSQEAVRILDDLGKNDEFLRGLFLYLMHREY